MGGGIPGAGAGTAGVGDGVGDGAAAAAVGAVDGGVAGLGAGAAALAALAARAVTGALERAAGFACPDLDDRAGACFRALVRADFIGAAPPRGSQDVALAGGPAPCGGRGSAWSYPLERRGTLKESKNSALARFCKHFA